MQLRESSYPIERKGSMRKHLIMAAIVTMALCLLASCNGASSGSAASSSASGATSASSARASSVSGTTSASSASSSAGSLVISTPQIDSAPVENSILRFNNDAGSARLVADMEAGMIPTSCVVLYDQMGTRPAVTVEDVETISKVYNLLADVTVGAKSPMSITDSYHQVAFKLQDGTTVRFSFEGEDLLSCDRDNYEVSGAGPLWAFVRAIQDDYLETHPEEKA